MELQPDFKELLELFNKNEVEYIVVGGFALAFHGAPRYTGDIDLFVNPCTENANRILKSLDEFGFGSVGLTIADFENPDKVVQLGVPPVRVDIITSLSGVSVKEAFSGHIAGMCGDVPVKYIGRTEFILNKRAAGRKKDLSDLDALDEK